MKNFSIDYKLIGKKILDYFFQGLLLVAPIGLTIYFIFILFRYADDLAQEYILSLLPFKIPGLGIILLFLIISILGYFGQRLITRPVSALFEKTLKKAPVIEMVYSSIKDFLSAFVGKDKKFKQPVLVKINPAANIEKIGFITETDLKELKSIGKVAVYLPWSYTFSGELIIVPADQVTPIDISSGDAMKFIISGGVSKAQ
jgi:uncharacterized membrane protein